MKQEKLALSAVMIVAIGLIGTNFVTGLETTESEKYGAISSNNDIYGHLTIVHSDPDGNILNYIQTDNIVAIIGKDCLAELVFGDHSTNCTASTNLNFTTIALFTDETFPDTMNATGLKTVDVTAAGLTITNGGQGVIVSTSANAISGGDGSKTDIAKTFTAGVGVTTQLVNGAALFNNATDAVLAGQVFSDVTLNESDTLLITWTIELG